jgi:hypothetical protein
MNKKVLTILVVSVVIIIVIMLRVTEGFTGTETGTEVALMDQNAAVSSEAQAVSNQDSNETIAENMSYYTELIKGGVIDKKIVDTLAGLTTDKNIKITSDDISVCNKGDKCALTIQPTQTQIFGTTKDAVVNISNVMSIQESSKVIGLYDSQIRLRNANDGNHVLKYSSSVDGPMLAGHQGGELVCTRGSLATSHKDANQQVLRWAQDRITINQRPLHLRSFDDTSHRLAHIPSLGNVRINGPELRGYQSGCLTTADSGSIRASLIWRNDRVSINDNFLFLRGIDDMYHTIRYKFDKNNNEDGIEIRGYGGGILKSSGGSEQNILQWAPDRVAVFNKPIHLYSYNDSNHLIKYTDSINGITINGPEVRGWLGGCLTSRGGQDICLQWRYNALAINSRPMYLKDINTASDLITYDSSVNGVEIRGTTGGKLTVNGYGTVLAWSTSGVKATTFIGNLIGTVSTTSDIKLKKNITDIDKQSYEKMYCINTKKYQLKDDAEEKVHYGVIAQEIEELYPELVSVQENDTKAVNYMELIPILIGNMKALRHELDELKKCTSNFEF